MGLVQFGIMHRLRYCISVHQLDISSCCNFLCLMFTYTVASFFSFDTDLLKLTLHLIVDLGFITESLGCKLHYTG